MTTVRAWLFSPAATVGRLAVRPSPLTWIIGTAAVMLAARVALLSTAVGMQAFVDQWVQRAEAFGMAIDDATFARFQTFGAYAPAYGALMALILGILLPLALAALLKTLGGTGVSWAAALTVSGYAGLPLAIRDGIGLAVGYVRETLTSPLTLGTFFPMLDEASPAARFLWSVDVFVLWWIVIAALATDQLTGRRALPVGVTLAGAYALAGVVLAVAMFVSGGA